jgi:hypothetical protein
MACSNLPGDLKIIVVITTKSIMGNFVFQAASPREVLSEVTNYLVTYFGWFISTSAKPRN